MFFPSSGKWRIRPPLGVSKKIPHEHLNKSPVNCRLCLPYIHLAATNRFYLFSLASLQKTKALPNIVFRRLVHGSRDRHHWKRFSKKHSCKGSNGRLAFHNNRHSDLIERRCIAIEILSNTAKEISSEIDRRALSIADREPHQVANKIRNNAKLWPRERTV
jgi:hypothetical protein